MKIGFLTIGTEILLGDTVNTNLTNLGKRLYENGFKLDKDITISDQQDEIINALNFLLKDCDVVITSGGLGPTEDDITKETISESLSLELELDDDHLEWMKERWKARGLIMPDTNIKQAYIPAGSEKLNNTQGTAPGIKINHDNKFIFIFPGPPREFIPLVEDELIPFLSKNYEKENTDYQFVMFFNQAESSLAAEIDKFKPEGLDIAYLASKGIIKLRFDKNSVSNDQSDMFLQKIGETFESKKVSISFESVEKKEHQNFNAVIGKFKILHSDGKIEFLEPELRIYNQPNIVTSEADIKTTLMKDKFIVINLVQNQDYFNVRYQVKPFMLWIWLSVIMISLGGLFSFLQKRI